MTVSGLCAWRMFLCISSSSQMSTLYTMGVMLVRPNRSAASSDATNAGRSGGGGGACGGEHR